MSGENEWNLHRKAILYLNKKYDDLLKWNWESKELAIRLHEWMFLCLVTTGGTKFVNFFDVLTCKT